jgi:endonuclease/exonuclease/phosphatase (EEP) superfamily protein YafD
MRTGKLRNLISKLKNGAINRSSEINTLIKHTQSSPYPFIICGDFNETPYGYNYHRLHSLFDNSFEKAGNGFGFTLNSLLFFLRIDHHFYGKGITAQLYKVDRSMNISDHFPTIGYYKIGD